MALDKPKLLYGASVKRGRYFIRFMRALLLVVAIVGAYLALDEAARREVIDSLPLDVGRLVAVAAGGLIAVRGLYNLIMTVVRRSESVRFYDQGFVWNRGRHEYKYAWHQLDRYREGAGGIYLLGRWPLLQWGAHRFTMRDGKAFKYNHRFGDTRGCADAIRRYTAYITGARMARTLRNEEPIKLNRTLTIYPTGIETRKKDIHWSDADVRMEHRRLVIRQRGKTGRFRVVSRYRPQSVDNVGGLLELSAATIRNYQPERFKK
jgi:hypothetical protein